MNEVAELAKSEDMKEGNPDSSVVDNRVRGNFGPGFKKFLRAIVKFKIELVVLLISVCVTFYYGVIASERYATEAQFVIKESGAQAELLGLAALGAVSSSARNSLLVKAFIESRDMAERLNSSISLRAHFQSMDIDRLSRLHSEATIEEYWNYYLKRIHVYHDEMSDIIKVEVQAFSPDYSKIFATEVLRISEEFINNLSNKMATEQVRYAELEVSRAHKLLKTSQLELIKFQEENQLFSPEQEGEAILGGINELQLQLIKAEARLKELTAVMRSGAPEVNAQKNLIYSLKKQLVEERRRLTDEKAGGFNKLSLDFQEVSVAVELAGELYKSSLISLDGIRSRTLQKLKHLLIVEEPQTPQLSKYPNRLYSIANWLIGLLISYLTARMLVTVINEHRD